MSNKKFQEKLVLKKTTIGSDLQGELEIYPFTSSICSLELSFLVSTSQESLVMLHALST